MRQYKKNVTETKEVEKIICNRCKKEIPIVAGVPAQDFLQVEKQWGYFSNKDNRRDSFELCEECYDALIKEFLIPVCAEDQDM